MIDRRTFLLTPLALLAAENKPNVVLVVAGGWRGQATPWAGDPDLVAPNLANFAKQAVVFPRAYSCDPARTPARAAIVTARYPHVTGAIADGAALRTEEVTIDTVLRAGGYHSSTVPEQIPAAPFFLKVFLDAPRMGEQVKPESLHPRENVPLNLLPKAAADLARRYSNYAALDAQFGKLLDSLDRVKPNTIVVFTSDHGEQIGSHGLDGPGVWYEESVRIPLAIRYPAVLQPSSSDLLVSQVDILPTLLSFCGEPAFEGIQGHDLAPLLTGQKGERPETVFVEGNLGQRDEWRMLVIGTDKIVVDANGEAAHLYNLASDPYEMTDLVREPAAKLKRDQLLAQLRAARQRLLDFKRR